MRVIEKEEAIWLEPMINRAIKQAQLSPCQKSQRGAVVFKGERILGKGFNAPIYPNTCIPEVCKRFCRFNTIHAERRACYDALSKGFDLTGASILHMKIKDGQIQPVNNTIGNATCLDCSAYLIKLKIDGMPLNELILWRADEEENRLYVAYSIEEFYRNSVQSLNL